MATVKGHAIFFSFLTGRTRSYSWLVLVRAREISADVHGQSSFCNNTVRSATHLLLKDLTTLPDVVCHLAVVSRESQRDPSFSGHNALEWQHRGLVKEVKMTKFANATLSPVWDEKFHL